MISWFIDFTRNPICNPLGPSVVDLARACAETLLQQAEGESEAREDRTCIWLLVVAVLYNKYVHCKSFIKYRLYYSDIALWGPAGSPDRRDQEEAGQARPAWPAEQALRAGMINMNISMLFLCIIVIIIIRASASRRGGRWQQALVGAENNAKIDVPRANGIYIYI